MNIGLDIHGVISINPSFYSQFSRIAVDQGHEIHILTGSLLTKSLLEELKSYDVTWNHLFSISEYHKTLGTSITYTAPNNPWMDAEEWNKTKAEYCLRNGIDFHIDDTEHYGEYFETFFALYDHKNLRLDWHFKNKKNGALKLHSPEETLKLIHQIILKI